MVLGKIGVQQIHGHTSHLHLPDADVYIPTKRVDRDQMLRPVFSRQRVNRHGVEVDGIVGILLPSIHADVLIEIALAIQNANGDQRDTEIRGGLQVVTG